MRRDPDDIIITSGATQALDLIARALRLRGDPVAIEEPGYPIARAVLQASGGAIVPMPVDDDGLRVDALPHAPYAPLMVYVTPAHQYPLGVRLSIARRMALLAWASTHDSLIVEDDYDSEFRFDAPPLPPLASLDIEGRVAYVGTFSKVLAPALRAGYLVVPPALRAAVVQLKSISDFHTSWATQRALLTLIAEGQLERHIRRMRRDYAEKRALLHAIFAPIAPLARLRGMEAGLHACLELRAGLDPNRILVAARARGVFAASLAGFYAGVPDRHGLVLGYGGLDPAAITRGATVLRDEIERCAQA
jgi:GntR family transcriptional regulator/MocR family aminotransferase